MLNYLRMKTLSFVCLLILSAHSEFVFADQDASLRVLAPEAAIHAAYENSPLAQKVEAQKEEASWKKVEGLSVFLPTLDFTANHFFEKKYQYLDLVFAGNPISFPQIFPSSSASLDAKWTLFDGFMNVNSYKAGSRIKTAGEEEFEWGIFRLGREVSLAYAKVVTAKKLSEVSEQNLKTLENHLNQVKNLKVGGLATNYDVLRVEAQLSEAQAELLQTKDNIQISQENLGLILGSTTPVDTVNMELAIPSTEKIKSLSFLSQSNQRLDLQAMQSRVDATDLMEDAYSLFWVPKVGLTGQYIRYNNITDTLSDWNNYRPAWNVGFFLTWELFNVRDFARAKQEKFKAIETEKTLQQANLQAPVDFAFWKKRFLYSASLYDAKKADLDRDQETVRLADAGFKAGVRTTTEVLDAELELFRARAGIVNTQMDCVEAKIRLELATGEKL